MVARKGREAFGKLLGRELTVVLPCEEAVSNTEENPNHNPVMQGPSSHVEICTTAGNQFHSSVSQSICVALYHKTTAQSDQDKR